jgi:hypothetical protein
MSVKLFSSPEKRTQKNAPRKTHPEKLKSNSKVETGLTFFVLIIAKISKPQIDRA